VFLWSLTHTQIAIIASARKNTLRSTVLGMESLVESFQRRKREGREEFDLGQSALIGGEKRLARIVGDVGHVPRHERRQNFQAGIVEGAAEQGSEHVLQRAVDGAGTEHVGPAAQRDRDHGLAARKPAAIVEPLAAVGQARDQYAVDPPFQDRGRGEPEHGKVEDQKIAP